MRLKALAVIVAMVVAAASAQAAETARAMYQRALAQEHALRAQDSPTLAQMHRLIAAYEAVVRVHPTSGYSDNALWQGAGVAELAFERFKEPADQATAKRLLTRLTSQYPSSSLVARAKVQLASFDATATPDPVHVETAAAHPAPPPETVPAADGPDMLEQVQRVVMPDGVRLILNLDAEAPFHQEEIDHPRRLFFDLHGVQAVASLKDATLKFDGDLAKEVRLGRHPDATRVVVDLDGVASYDVYPLYGPYRLVVDLHRTKGAAAPAVSAAATAFPAVAATTSGVSASPGSAVPAALPDITAEPVAPKSAPLIASDPLPTVSALPPAANSNGKFSLSRQLGLGVSRIVIDAGHGGHDPGAQGNGINEAELTLDVAQRLKALLEKQPGIEVVMTRDTDVFVPLQERTEIANRENADLFLSIHANASRNADAHGVETYFLNFAMNPEAEAVAARENASSGQPMHSLPDLVKTIALNNKINESRDFAATVQRSMVKKLSAKNHHLRDLGVKQAPFVVLIGATMPSVLAEISFVTNKQDGSLLKTGPYRQQVAQALADAVLKYQQELKRTNATSGKKATY